MKHRLAGIIDSGADTDNVFVAIGIVDAYCPVSSFCVSYDSEVKTMVERESIVVDVLDEGDAA